MNCQNKTWNTCCGCRAFESCDIKEYNRQGALVVLSGDFRNLLKRLKRNCTNIDNEFLAAEDDSYIVRITGKETGKTIYQKI